MPQAHHPFRPDVLHPILPSRDVTVLTAALEMPSCPVQHQQHSQARHYEVVPHAGIVGGMIRTAVPEQ